MISTRRLGWTTLALLALVGCDSTTTPPPASTTSPSDKLPKGEMDAPVAPTPPKTDDAKKDTPEVKAMPTTEPAKPAEEPKKDEPKTAEAGKFSDTEMAEIKKLAPEDQAIALAQMTCPVSDEKLGAMGVPIKQAIGDKTFLICCAGCKDKVKDKPEEVLAKLKK